jgi:protein ImuB
MLWLALHLPLLSLEAFCATLPAAMRSARWRCWSHHHIGVVNAAAARCGLRPGLKRATALALAADLLLAEAAPARDAAALQAVAHAALAFTPAVARRRTRRPCCWKCRPACACSAAWRPCAAAGGRTGAAGPPGADGGCANGPGCGLLAQWQPVEAGDAVLGAHACALPALRALLQAAPLVLLQAGREHAQTLQGMGLHSLGDLAALPRAGLSRRFGAELIDEWDRAWGRRPDPRNWLSLPACFESRIELHTRAESTDQVLHAAAVLLARLVAWAQARNGRIAACTLHMLHERQRQVLAPPTVLHLALAEPALDAAHLQTLLRERLARTALHAPTLELRLYCADLVPGQAPNGELFPSAAAQAEGLARLLERLRARLGDDQVRCLVPVADHRPECGSRQCPPRHAAGHLPQPMVRPLAADLPLHRPAWLLPEPLPLAERDALPLLQGRPLQLLSGPERIEAGWWDGQGVARDYFIALASDGSLVWVWRARLAAPPGEVNWYLQGRFA